MSRRDNVLFSHPGRLRSLVAALDARQPALAAVQRHAAAGDWTAAANNLRDWLRQHLAAPAGAAALALARRFTAIARGDSRNDADTVAAWRAGRFPWLQIEAPVPRLPDGRWDWLDHGPRRDIEWAFALNRHRFIGSLLLTGLNDDARCCQLILDDWLSQWGDEELDYTALGDRDGGRWWPRWRNLECALRLMGPWQLAILDGVQRGWLEDGTMLLLLADVDLQCRILHRHHGHNPNHKAMELTALAFAALAFPCFADGEAWLAYARNTMEGEPTQQVYPDGHQKELTSHYHWVATTHLQEFAEVIETLDPRPLPAAYRGGVERMWHCLAATQAPDGTWPLSNDSDIRRIADDLLPLAEHYGRDDWRHIASLGALGPAPAWGPSHYLPWAGQLISRSGFTPDSHWSWFDCGPHGISGHQHYDKLHLSVYAHGRHLLVDNGRFTHRGDLWRQHFIGSYSHNVVLVDGHGQDEGVEVVVEPCPNHVVLERHFDFVCSHFDSTYLNMQGEAVHTRAVCYVRGRCWVIIDRVSLDRDRELMPLWHFHPDCTVEADGFDAVSSDAGLGNLRIHPVGGQPWRLDLRRGDGDDNGRGYRMWKADWCPKNGDDIAIQGWHAPHYNVKLPATCAQYRLRVPGTTTWAWVLVPAVGLPPRPLVSVRHLDAEAAHLHIDGLPGGSVEISASLGPARPLPLDDGSIAMGVCRVRCI
jgi:hypothetical protein